MDYQELIDFLENRMRMSHIYQPLLIKSLIEAGGTATVRQLAHYFISQDESLLIEYENTLKKMPIPVLKKHKVIAKDGDLVYLNTKKMDFNQKAEIKKICEQRIQEFISKRGLKIWDYRLMDDPVSDPLRLKVLRDGKGRCALCGATKDERPLHVDHIIPRSKGGKTVCENLQILCEKCNCTKRDLDDMDYRNLIGDSVIDGCLFCSNQKKKESIIQNEFAYAILDGFPVTEGHTLVIPKRHFPDYFEITDVELRGVHDLVRIRKNQLGSEDSSIDGFNVGVNSGESAGQTIFHCHIHLIPRRYGDVERPRGGVRGVIPEKMGY